MALIKLTTAIRLADDAERTPPTEFRIFPLGDFASKKGTFTFDKASGESVIAAWQEHGADLAFDYEHASLSQPGEIAEGAPAAGWFTPEVRDDGLYATNIKWTGRAAEYLKNGEYRYFSPAFAADPDTNRVLRLVNIALTNLPATQDQEPLVNLRTAIDLRTIKLSEGLSFNAIQEALNAAVQSQYAEKNDDGTLKSYLWVCDVYDDHAVYSKDGKLFDITYRMEGATAVLTGTPAEVRRTYSYVKEGTTIMDIKELAKKLGLSEDATEEQINAKIEELLKKKDEGEELADDEEKKKKDEEMKALSEVVKLTGQSGAAAQGVLLGWKAASEQVVSLSQRLQALETEKRTNELNGLIETGLKDGKLVPAQKTWALSIGVDALKGYLAAAPQIVNTSVVAAPKDGVVTLTDEDRAAMVQMGLTEEQYLKTKQRHAGQK